MTESSCPACGAEIDYGSPRFDCGQYDGQETRMKCPSCGTILDVTTHIRYTAVVAKPNARLGRTRT